MCACRRAAPSASLITLNSPNTNPSDLKSAAGEAAGTSGEGVPTERAAPPAGEGDREFELLAQLQQDSGAKQRDLARAVGMSLGMTNALLKRLAAKGFITMKRTNSRKIQYVITPEGMQEAARRSRRYLKRTMKHVVRYKDTVRKACRHAAGAPPAGRGSCLRRARVAQTARPRRFAYRAAVYRLTPARRGGPPRLPLPSRTGPVVVVYLR